MFGMEEEPEKRLIGYARVSTQEQDPALQIDALTRYGVKPEHIFIEYASGGRMDRPQLQKALRSMRAEDTIVVWKLDRLGRTLTGIIEVAEQMQKEGVNLISLTDKIDTTTAMGRMFFHIIASFAQLERDLIAERTKAGMAVRKAEGAKFGQPSKIKDNPKRLAEARRIIEEGAENITAEVALARLNRADPKAKKIKSPETWRRWLRLGCPGVDEPIEEARWDE